MPASARLVINEVDYDQPGLDTAEFIEIKNTTAAAINLDPYALLAINGGTVPPTVYRRYELPAYLLLPGDYYVVCASAITVPNCDLDSSPNLSMLEDGAPDAIAVVFNTRGNPVFDELVDAVSYEGNTAGGPWAGGSWTETSGVAVIDDGLYPGASISRYPDGVDTNHNDSDLACRNSTPGEANGPGNGACTGSGHTWLWVWDPSL